MLQDACVHERGICELCEPVTDCLNVCCSSMVHLKQEVGSPELID